MRVMGCLNLVCIEHVTVRTRVGAVCAPFENEMGATRVLKTNLHLTMSSYRTLIILELIGRRFLQRSS